MKWKLMLIPLAMALVAAMAGAPAQASTSIYVGAGHGYFAAFKVEDGHPFVLGLDVRSYCRGTGAHSDENEGQLILERFTAPVPMAPTREGLWAEDETYRYYRSERAVVRARFQRGEVGGTLVGAYDEKNFQCQSGRYRGSPKVRFRAIRYVRVGSARARRPSGSPRVGGIYYTRAGGIEVLLRRTSPSEVEVRGAVGQRCTVPASESNPPRVPIFPYISDPTIWDRGGFRERFHEYGPGRGHTTFGERATLTGRLETKFAVGRYLRVKAKKRGDRIVRRCETKPVHYRAIRYLPAR